jgi:hypothetical protein
VSMKLMERKKNVYSQVYEEAHSLPEMINCTDIDESAESWDEVSQEDITPEVKQSASVMMDENQFKNRAKPLALHIWIKDLNRASMADLVFDTKAEALKNGYLPSSMSWQSAESKLTEMNNAGEVNIPNSAWDEAYNVIRAAIVDKLDPNAEKGESLLYDFN